MYKEYKDLPLVLGHTLGACEIYEPGFKVSDLQKAVHNLVVRYEWEGHVINSLEWIQDSRLLEFLVGSDNLGL